MTLRRDTVETTTTKTAIAGPIRWWLLVIGVVAVLTLLTWGFASSVQRATVADAEQALADAALSGVIVDSATYRDVTLEGPAGDEAAARAALASLDLPYGVTYVTVGTTEPAPSPSPEAAPEPEASATPEPTTSPEPVEIAALPDLAGVQFETGKSTLTAGGRAVLTDAAAALLGALPDHPGLHVTIEGHTDAEGDEAANLALSQQRADAVLAYLAAEGVPADSLSAKGYGETRPISDNTTTDGRAANRRVDFIITEGM